MLLPITWGSPAQSYQLSSTLLPASPLALRLLLSLDRKKLEPSLGTATASVSLLVLPAQSQGGLTALATCKSRLRMHAQGA